MREIGSGRCNKRIGPETIGEFSSPYSPMGCAVVRLGVLLAWLLLRGKALSDIVILNKNVAQVQSGGGLGHYEAIRVRVHAPA